MKNTGFRARLHAPGRTRGLRSLIAGILALGLLTGSTGALRAQVKVEAQVKVWAQAQARAGVQRLMFWAEAIYSRSRPGQ